MNAARSFPWPGTILALAAGAGMFMAGADPWLIVAVLLLWISSLWISRPPEQIAQPQTDSVQLTRDGMRDMIEQFSLPLLLLDMNRVIIANSAARVVFGKHIVGQDARIALGEQSLLTGRQGRVHRASRLAHPASGFGFGLWRQRADLTIRERKRRAISHVPEPHLAKLVEVGRRLYRCDGLVAKALDLVGVQGSHLDGVVVTIGCGHGE